MTAPPDPELGVILVFHGGIQDGLVISSPEAMPEIPLPSDIVINNLKDYAKWTPYDGEILNVYVRRSGPVPYRSTTYPAFHMFLDRQLTLHETGPTNP